MDLTDQDDPPRASGGRADEIALELLKQLITLSVAVLALTATFIEEVGSGPRWSLGLLVLSWVGFLVAIVCCLKSISAIVKGRLDPLFDWSKGVGHSYARAGQASFFAGISVFLIFALLTLFFGSAPTKSSASPLDSIVVGQYTVGPFRLGRECDFDDRFTFPVDDIVALLTSQPAMRTATLRGGADQTRLSESAQAVFGNNIALARARAKCVADSLVSRGVSARQLFLSVADPEARGEAATSAEALDRLVTITIRGPASR